MVECLGLSNKPSKEREREKKRGVHLRSEVNTDGDSGGKRERRARECLRE